MIKNKQKVIHMEEKKENKVEKKEEKQTVEIDFNVGMESIGEPLDVDNILDNIYAAVDN